MAEEIWVKIDISNIRVGTETKWDGGATRWDSGSTIWDTEELPANAWTILDPQ